MTKLHFVSVIKEMIESFHENIFYIDRVYRVLKCLKQFAISVVNYFLFYFLAVFI